MCSISFCFCLDVSFLSRTLLYTPSKWIVSLLPAVGVRVGISVDNNYIDCSLALGKAVCMGLRGIGAVSVARH